MAEWLNALVLKTSEGESLPRVRISPPPPIVSSICASQLGYQAKHTQKHTFKLSLLKPIPARSRACRCPYLAFPHSGLYFVGDLLTLLRKRPQTHPLTTSKWPYPDPTPGGTPTCSERFPNLLLHTILDERLSNLENKAMKPTMSSFLL